MCNPPSHGVIGITMNLISGTNHSCGGTHFSCESGVTHLFVVMGY